MSSNKKRNTSKNLKGEWMPGTKNYSNDNLIGYKSYTASLEAYIFKNRNVLKDADELEQAFETDTKGKNGIYFLYSYNENPVSSSEDAEESISNKPKVYVGKTEESYRRIIGHENNRSEWYYNDWTEAILFITSDDNMTPSERDNLEAIFIEIFKNRNNTAVSLNKRNQKLKYNHIDEKKQYKIFAAIVEKLQEMKLLDKDDYEEIEENTDIDIKDLIKEASQEIIKELKETKDDRYDFYIKRSKYEDLRVQFSHASSLVVHNRILSGVLNKKALDEVITPREIAEKMVNSLPNEVFDGKHTFFDPACKSGIFLQLILEKLMSDDESLPINHNPDFSDKQKRLVEIVDKCIFGATLSTNGWCVTQHNLIETIERIQREIEDSGIIVKTEDKVSSIPHIIYLDNYRNEMTDKDFAKTLAGLFRIQGENEVQFDVVIGNPPYNRGMDLDFVNLGYDLVKEDTGKVSMVIPGKWQTAEANQSILSNTITYGEFREKLVPHMSHVHFYPCCKDVFDIYQTDGITYFLLDRGKTFEKATVVNKCNDIACFNSTEERSILNAESLLNIGNEIIESLGDYTKFHFPEITHTKRYEIWMNTKVSGYDWYATKNPRYVLSTSRLLDKSKGDKYDGEAKCIFESDDIEECKSFASWIYSRFTRFFLVPNISKLNNIQTDHCFRFVPAPVVLDANGNRVEGKFDHIYTDEELYKTFNLPQKYIDIIETVVKEREAIKY